LKIFNENHAVQNALRGMQIMKETYDKYMIVNGDELRMAKKYQISTGKAKETGSIWKYTCLFEMINPILKNLKTIKGDNPEYQKLHDYYVKLLRQIYENMDYFLGDVEVTSFTQTKTWSVYAVNRVSEKGKADATGRHNVYDDQQWLVRELLDAYEMTGDKTYLEKAEYLTEYTLDGWDCTIDENGNENGGIPWGPGYTSKHTCSNGPFISPLVWLHELYKDKDDMVTYRIIDPVDRITRKKITEKKSDYYLKYAQKVYHYTRDVLLDPVKGIYWDMVSCRPGTPIYDSIPVDATGIRYRKTSPCGQALGRQYTYNAGSTLSGVTDLYRVTRDERYLEEAKNLADASFKWFTTLDKNGFYVYDTKDAFKMVWFNGVLLRALIELSEFYDRAAYYVDEYQRLIDHGYDKYYRGGFLPSDLSNGWKADYVHDDEVEAMQIFAYSAQYSKLAEYQFAKPK